MDHSALPLAIDRSSAQPAYRQLARQVASLVREGRLAPGDRLPGERELAGSLGVARGTVQKALVELLRMGVVASVHGSGTFVAGLPPADSGLVRVAGIDCNPEALSNFARQFADLPDVRFEAMDLDGIRAGMPGAPELAGYDLLLTTTTHDAELRRLVPALAERILPAAVAPSQRTVVEMARIPAGAAVGIVCRSERFRRIIETSLAALGHDLADVGYLPEDTLVRGGRPAPSSAARLAAFLAGTSVAVVPPDSPVDPGSPSFGAVLAPWIERGGRIVAFEYRMERGTLVHVEEAVERIRARRTAGGGKGAPDHG